MADTLQQINATNNNELEMPSSSPTSSPFTKNRLSDLPQSPMSPTGQMPGYKIQYSHPGNLRNTQAIPDYEYVLPKTIEAVRQGWVTSGQAFAVVSTLLVGANTTLFGLFNEDNARELWNTNRHAFNFLRVVSYGTFFMTLGGTISSLILIDLLADTTMQAYKKQQNGELNQAIQDALGSDGSQKYSTWALLQGYGDVVRIRKVFFHCILSLVAGLLGITAQITTWLWLQHEDRLQVALPVTIAILWCFKPVLEVWVLPFMTEFRAELKSPQGSAGREA